MCAAPFKLDRFLWLRCRIDHCQRFGWISLVCVCVCIYFSYARFDKIANKTTNKLGTQNRNWTVEPSVRTQEKIRILSVVFSQKVLSQLMRWIFINFLYVFVYSFYSNNKRGYYLFDFFSLEFVSHLINDQLNNGKWHFPWLQWDNHSNKFMYSYICVCVCARMCLCQLASIHIIQCLSIKLYRILGNRIYSNKRKKKRTWMAKQQNFSHIHVDCCASI